MAPRVILLAEDNPDDSFIFKMMFRKAALPHSLHLVEDGQQAIDWLLGQEQYVDRGKCPLPDLLVLDLKMPLKTGLDVLEWMRSHQQFKNLPVVILSSSDDPQDVERASRNGVTHYFVKSPQLQDVMQFLRDDLNNK